MGCWTYGAAAAATGGAGMERMQERAAQWFGPRGGGGTHNTSGNRAFDEYREDTLRRLEEEERQFKEFLDRLRHAKDKAEFDQFMAEMRRRREGHRRRSRPDGNPRRKHAVPAKAGDPTTPGGNC